MGHQRLSVAKRSLSFLAGEREKEWSGTRGSNPRHPAWEAGTLPTELVPLEGVLFYPGRGWSVNFFYEARCGLSMAFSGW
jgi:hypothetical protein